MHQDYKFGIAGGIWTAVIGIFYLYKVSLPASGGAAQFGSLVFVSAITLSEIAALIAVMKHRKRPRLSRALIWLGILFSVTAFFFMGPLGLGLFIFPGMVLLVPAAVRMTWPNFPVVRILSIIGGIWAFFPIAVAAFQAFTGMELLPTFAVVSVCEAIAGVLAALAVFLQRKRPMVSYFLILSGVALIFAALLALAPDPLGIFETLPAVAFLIPAAFKISSSVLFEHRPTASNTAT